ncbi:hypothetical protein [Burkholderia vietnamiensis]|uniref:hypothetical protein n=1 Tax=Burkholderia vietnamiensis TaxID=60552 RepID=UPI001CF0EA90|nr:hypothetical protein [Burkholderia vietnamiensis]MCA8449006.1 hypothetical protein [Burkholderia vietnamiensis]
MPIVKTKPRPTYQPLTPADVDRMIIAHIGNPDLLSDMVQITPAQLELITGRKPKQQEEDRRRGVGPKAHTYGPRGEIRYYIGEVRKANEKFKPKSNTAEAVLAENDDLAVLMRMNFSDFLDNAGPNDPWPFIVHDGVPIDFFKSLDLDSEDLSDEDTAVVLTLDDYLSKRKEAAWAHEAAREAVEVRAYADQVISEPLPSLKDVKPNGGRL